MPKCCVIGCPSRRSENQKTLTLHRLPRSGSKNKKWLEAIGAQNIRQNVKDLVVCSLHFLETDFNRTLNVIRLRDDAVPLHPDWLPVESASNPVIATEPVPDTPATLPVEPMNDPLITTESVPDTPALLPVESKNNPVIATEPVNVTSALQCKKIKTLEQKCAHLHRKVRTLNEKVRRQKKKLAEFKSTIKDLRDRNLILESCAGSKDLKRQILKSKGLPLEPQYTEAKNKNKFIIVQI